MSENQNLPNPTSNTGLNVSKSVKSLLSQDNVKKRFEEILKDRAGSFIANLSVIVSTNPQLQQCEPVSVISAAIISASLNLPIDPNLGKAAIVPFNKKGSSQKVAQFQIMYKGFIELAERTGSYKRIRSTEIYEGQLIKEDNIKGIYEFNESKKVSDNVIGFYAYYIKHDGAEKEVYWSKEKVINHAKKFSASFRKGYGLWIDDFIAMGKKTVIKALLNSGAELSIESSSLILAMRKYDQAVIKGNLDNGKLEEFNATFDDNPSPDEETENALMPNNNIDEAEIVSEETGDKPKSEGKSDKKDEQPKQTGKETKKEPPVESGNLFKPNTDFDSDKK